MRPDFGDEEKQELMGYMSNDVFLTEFKKTLELEEAIASFINVKHVILVNNGTISLTIIAYALGIKPGDEVIVPNYTMIATPNSIKLLGATPVFVDVDPDTLVMDYECLERAITSKTKAIIIVLANGREPKNGIQKFVDLASRHGLALIEDAAQALGSYYSSGKHIGLSGAAGSFSLSAPKIISTGQGGFIVTNDDRLAVKIRKIKDFGRSAGGNDVHDEIGFNFKFTDLQACIGLAQLKKLQARLVRKKQIVGRYKSNLSGLKGIHLFEHDLSLCAPWFVDARVCNRSELIDYLGKKGIGTRVMYPPINKQLAYGTPGDFPVSDEIGKSGLWLPSYITLEDSDIDYVCNEIKNFCDQRFKN